MSCTNLKSSQCILITILLSFIYSKGDTELSSKSSQSDGIDIDPSYMQNATISDNTSIEFRWLDNFTLPANLSDSDGEFPFDTGFRLYRPASEDDDNESALFEGDMMTGNLTAPEFRRIIGYNEHDDALSDIKLGNEILWPNAELPFVFGPDCSKALRHTWKKAVDFFKDYTCIVIRPKHENELEYVYISQKTARCGMSNVGSMKGFKIELKIGLQCENSLLAVIHEIMHALGFVHEQSRPDRDEHLSFAFSNILPSEMDNFQKYYRVQTSTFDLPYDFFSIMHYTWNAFSISERTKPTVIAKDAKVIVGQQKFVSMQDITQIKKNYKCPNENSHYNTKCPVDKPFKCTKTMGCLPKSLICNGNNDCGDNSDEQGCSVPQNNETTALWKIIEYTAVKIVNQKVPPGFATGLQSTKTAETNMKNQEMIPIDDIINNCLTCICEVVTPGCKAAVGSSCKKDINCGPYQLTKAYWDQCGQPKPDGKSDSNWQDCASDIKCSRKCVKHYSIKYANVCAAGGPPNCETMARVHKGGEFGCRIIMTYPFWKKVKTCLQVKQK